MRLTNKCLALASVLCWGSVWIAPLSAGAQTALVSESAKPPLSPAAGLALATSKTCLGCHQVDAKRVGPAFQAIAKRHGDQAGAIEYLASAIQQGGRGRWGAIPMPAQPQVSQQDALQLAQWIITLR